MRKIFPFALLIFLCLTEFQLNAQPPQRLRAMAEDILVHGFPGDFPAGAARHLGFGSKAFPSRQMAFDDSKDSAVGYGLEVFRWNREIVIVLFQLVTHLDDVLMWRLDLNGKIVGHPFRYSLKREVAKTSTDPKLIKLAEFVVPLALSLWEKHGIKR